MKHVWADIWAGGTLIQRQCFTWADKKKVLALLGRKSRPERQPSLTPFAESLSAMRAVCRLNRFARGRSGAKGGVAEQVRHTTFVTVPPR